MSLMKGTSSCSFQQWLSQQDPKKVRQCPVCHSYIMTCKSEVCKGNTFFCMICGMHLSKKHEKHDCEIDGSGYEGSRLEHWTQDCRLM